LVALGLHRYLVNEGAVAAGRVRYVQVGSQSLPRSREPPHISGQWPSGQNFEMQSSFPALAAAEAGDFDIADTIVGASAGCARYEAE
jgi:hypothetical protein